MGTTGFPIRCNACKGVSEFRSNTHRRLIRKAHACGWITKRLAVYGGGSNTKRQYHFCPECVEAKRTSYGDVARAYMYKPEPAPLINVHEAAKIVLAKHPYALIDSIKGYHVIRSSPGGEIISQAILRSDAWLLAGQVTLGVDLSIKP
jgi:hypothetical protein